MAPMDDHVLRYGGRMNCGVPHVLDVIFLWKISARATSGDLSDIKRAPKKTRFTMLLFTESVGTVFPI